jgi:hypothetical protein
LLPLRRARDNTALRLTQSSRASFLLHLAFDITLTARSISYVSSSPHHHQAPCQDHFVRHFKTDSSSTSLPRHPYLAVACCNFCATQPSQHSREAFKMATCYNNYTRQYYTCSSWDRYGRWIFLACIIVFALFVFFLFR